MELPEEPELLLQQARSEGTAFRTVQVDLLIKESYRHIFWMQQFYALGVKQLRTVVFFMLLGRR